MSSVFPDFKRLKLNLWQRFWYGLWAKKFSDGKSSIKVYTKRNGAQVIMEYHHD